MKKYFFLFFFISFASPLFAGGERTVSETTQRKRLRELICWVLDANYYQNYDKETDEKKFFQKLRKMVKENPSLCPTYSSDKGPIPLSQQEADFAGVTGLLFEAALAVATKKGPPIQRRSLNLATRLKINMDAKKIKKLFGPIGSLYLDKLEQRLLEAGIEPSELNRPVAKEIFLQ